MEEFEAEAANVTAAAAKAFVNFIIVFSIVLKDIKNGYNQNKNATQAIKSGHC